MRRTIALVPVLALAVLAEEGAIPFRLGPKGFEEGETPCRLELLHKGPVDSAVGTLDGAWIVWKVAGTVFARQGGSVREFAIPSKSRLLGCTRDGRLLAAEPSGAEAVLAAYDLAGGQRAALWEGADAKPLLDEGSAGLLGALGVLAVKKDSEITFESLDHKAAGKAACASGVPDLVSYGARAVVVLPRTMEPVLLSPDSAPAQLDPVLAGATAVALSPDRPFIAMSTSFDFGFVSLSTPGLRTISLEGYVPVAWPSRSAVLLTKTDGLYLLTLTDDGPSGEEIARGDEEEKRRQAERARLEERKLADAERARLEEEKRAEAERVRLEQEKQELTDAERAKLEEEEKRKQAEMEQARLEEEKRKEAERARLEEEKRRQEGNGTTGPDTPPDDEPPPDPLLSEMAIVDHAGLEKARLGDLADAVKAVLSEPDQRLEGEIEGTTDWIYASSGLVLTFEDESKQLVRVLAKGRPDFLPAGLKDRFRPYRGKTGKGIALGASRAEIEEAYGKPVRVVTVGAAEMLRYDGEKARMSFQVERGKLVLILVQREK
ncbi:MAG: hypothetical protein AAB434_03805 [Planctomycetota bacterium]